ncbi:MAG: sulfite exporter TauE/SafE family protein, partial [Planctomycetes bacterium]|nr:sulfite exporter TauE/SafE family protein [Planctomycetota bacterium]
MAVVFAAPEASAADRACGAGGGSWWFWPLALLIFTFFVGVISPISGIGGGVLFVSLTAAFSPFSIDFIRGAGLIMPLTTALSAAPRFTRKGLANLKIMAPVVVVTMITSVIGSVTGLWITNTFPNGQHYVTIALGLVLFFIFAVMGISKRVEFPNVPHSDPVSEKLGLRGSWFEPSLDKVVEYKATNFAVALPAFAAVGFIAGMFGLGAGWANVPALNLIMGVPIKVATSTSMMIITINDASAAWVYLANGAVLPVIVIPSVVGITIGARVGA